MDRSASANVTAPAPPPGTAGHRAPARLDGPVVSPGRPSGAANVVDALFRQLIVLIFAR